MPNTGDATGFFASLLGRGDTLFTLRQDGSRLTGTVEGADSGDFGGNDEVISIEEGKVEGNSVYFKAGSITFSGTLKADQIELKRTVDSPLQPTSTREAPTVRRTAIGSPPDGSDPSEGVGGETPPAPFVLHRVQR
jgi:beta-galactosidase